MGRLFPNQPDTNLSLEDHCLNVLVAGRDLMLLFQFLGTAVAAHKHPYESSERMRKIATELRDHEFGVVTDVLFNQLRSLTTSEHAATALSGVTDARSLERLLALASGSSAPEYSAAFSALVKNRHPGARERVRQILRTTRNEEFLYIASTEEAIEKDLATQSLLFDLTGKDDALHKIIRIGSTEAWEYVLGWADKAGDDRRIELCERKLWRCLANLEGRSDLKKLIPVPAGAPVISARNPRRAEFRYLIHSIDQPHTPNLMDVEPLGPDQLYSLWKEGPQRSLVHSQSSLVFPLQSDHAQLQLEERGFRFGAPVPGTTGNLRYASLPPGWRLTNTFQKSEWLSVCCDDLGMLRVLLKTNKSGCLKGVQLCENVDPMPIDLESFQELPKGCGIFRKLEQAFDGYDRGYIAVLSTDKRCAQLATIRPTKEGALSLDFYGVGSCVITQRELDQGKLIARTLTRKELEQLPRNKLKGKSGKLAPIPNGISEGEDDDEDNELELSRPHVSESPEDLDKEQRAIEEKSKKIHDQEIEKKRQEEEKERQYRDTLLRQQQAMELWYRAIEREEEEERRRWELFRQMEERSREYERER